VDLQCCTNLCTAGKCALRACFDNGADCNDWSDCCSGTCAAGFCAATPACSWLGSCVTGSDCCSGACTGSVCQLPIANGGCPHLENGDGVWATCFDCMSDNCCSQKTGSEVGSNPGWEKCINECMSKAATWDAYAKCEMLCGNSQSGVELCMSDNCTAQCPN
jgi:hypothetical protein